MTAPLGRRQFVLAALATAVVGGCRRQTAGVGMRYRVEPGDTLSSVARKAGISIASLVEVNDIRSRHLQPGQELWLPGITRLPPAEVEPDHRIPTTMASYRIIKRRDWGAARMGANHDPMNGIRKITLHHTSEIPGMMHRSDRDLVAAVQHYHQGNLGWADIGYHYLIGRDGNVYEGRPLHAQGAHCGGARNRHNLGVAVIGDFQRELPTPAQLATIEHFLIDQQQRYQIRQRELLAHREVGVTICPGDQLYGWYDDFRRQV